MDKIREEKILNVPNILTILRIVMLPFVIWRFMNGDRTGALVLYILLALTDLVDGFIARKFNLITNFGKLMDPLADKLALLTMLVLFCIEGTIAPWVVALVVTKELAMVVGGGFALTRGIVVHALPIGKAATVVYALSVICLLLEWDKAGKGLLTLAVILMLCALCYYLFNLVRTLRTQEHK